MVERNLSNTNIQLKRGEIQMILTPEKLLRIQRTSKELNKVTKKNLSFSETRSLCSNIPVRKASWSLGGLKKLTSSEAIHLILHLPEMNKDWRFAVWMELTCLPKKYQYQGKWEIVHQLLRNYKSMETMVNTLLNNGYSENAIFGIVRDKTLSRLEKINIYDPYRHKVNKPQRKRGYNDHGSRKEDHKWLPWNAYAIEEQVKEDRESELLDLHPNFKLSIWHRIKSSLTHNNNHKEKNLNEE